MHKLLPEIKVDYRKFSITAMKEMLSSGIWNSFNQASNILLTSLDLLLANVFLGSVISGTYSVSKTGSARKVAHFGSWPSMER